MLSIRRDWISIVAVVWLLTACYAHAEDAAAIIQRASQSPKLITSVEFLVEGTTTDTDTGKDIPQQLHFLGKQDMFLCEFKSGEQNSKDPATEMVLARDRNKFQFLNANSETLSLSSSNQFSNPYLTIHPLVAPYIWLFDPKEGSLSWASLRDADLWKQAIKRATYVGELVVKGRKCAKIDFAVSPTDRYSVIFDLDNHCFPISTEAWAGDKLIGKVEASKLIDAPVDGKTAVVATQITYSQTLGNKLDKGGWTIDPKSLQFNPAIDEKQFTIAHSRARFVKDADEINRRFPQPKDQAIQSPKSDTQGRGWLLTFNVSVVIVLVLLFVARRFIGARK